MDKYRLYDKIIKTKACTYYRAQCQTHDKVIVKRINKITTWQQLLTNKDLTLMKQSQSKYFPGIKEIVKDQDQFYVIMEKLEKNLEYVIKKDITKQEIFKIGRLLIQMAINLTQKKIHPREIRPVHLFVDENLTTIKLAHLQVVNKDITKLDLVQLQDLRYLSPEQVLTSKQIDQRTIIFNIGLIICDLIIGKSLITANTKMHYIYQLCRLFPQDKIGDLENSEHQLKPDSNNSQDNFQKVIRKYNFSSQFVALLRQMLKMDRNQRLAIGDLLDAYDVVVENQKNYEIQAEKMEEIVELETKPNIKQFPINDQIDFQLDFQLEQKPTISIIPTINKLSSDVLPIQKNVEDDVTQPIIIKQSKSNDLNKLHHTVNKLHTTKQSQRRSRATVQMNSNSYGNHLLNGQPNNPSLSTLRKPQLTNYALNEANLGVKMGMNPSIFSENDI